jgi:hypothetical protein
MRRLLLVAGVSLLFHAKGLFAPPLDYHYHRQCNTAAIARNFHEHGLRFYYPQIDWEGAYDGRAATELPLYMWLTGLLWDVGGLGDAWARLLSAAFSALTAVFLVLLYEKRLGKDAALWAGLIFSAIPLEIYFGRTIQPEAIALFCSVAALYFWQEDKPVPAVLLAATGFAHKLPYLHLLMPLLALSLEKRGAKAFQRLSTWLAPAAALGLVYAWYAYAGSGRYVVPAHKSEFATMLQYGRLAYFIQFQVFSRFLELATTYGGMILFVIGARLLWKRRDWFLGAWFASVWIILIAGGGYSFHHEYTMLPIVPVAAGAMALGLLELRKRAPAWAVWLIVASIPVYGTFRISHWYHQNHPYLAGAERAADAVSARGDLFITNERASSSFLYFFHRKGWGWDLAEMGPERLTWVDDKIKEGAKFFATAKSGMFTNPDEPYAKFFAKYPLVWDRDGLLIYDLRKPKPRE